MEVKQAASEVQDAIVSIKELEIQIPQQENLLSVLIGNNPQAIPRGLTIDELYLPASVPAGLPSDILDQRPDVREAEEAVIAANAEIGAAKALFFPQFNLTGIYGNESVHLRDLFTGKALQWDYVVSFLVPLFNAGRTYFLVDAAKMNMLEALYQHQKAVQTAFQEVDDALISFQKTKELVEVLHEQVHILEDYLHLATLQYDNGQTDYLNVLDAERKLFSAQFG